MTYIIFHFYQMAHETMIWYLLSVLLLLQTQPTVAYVEYHPITRALQFGTTVNDFCPDTKPVKNSLTDCAWAQKQLTGDSRSWMTYTTEHHADEILISDADTSNIVNNTYLDVEVAVPLGTWTHQCITWSTSSGTMKTYYNGTLIGSEPPASLEPRAEGGYVLLGHELRSPETSEIFGGQLMKLNLFSSELSAGEVAELYTAGRCSNVEKKNEEVRFITWESILSQDKTGNVTEVDFRCPAPKDISDDEIEEEADRVKEEIEDKLKNEEFAKEAEIDECDCLVPNNISDILLDEKYLNETLTAKKVTELKAVWNVWSIIILLLLNLLNMY